MLVVQAIDEVAFWNIPERLAVMPTGFRDPLLWWSLIKVALLQEDVLLHGPPRDVEWLVTNDREQLLLVRLRHECRTCEDALRGAQQWMADRPGEWMAFVQYTQDYLQNPRELAFDKFHAR